MNRKTFVTATVVCAVVALVTGGAVAFAGSASGPNTPLPGRDARLPEGFKGPVTQVVYEDAFAQFKGCMSRGGAALVGERLVGAVHEYSYLAEKRPVYDKCYAGFTGIDFQWQVAHSYDSPAYVSLRQCLTDMGVQPGEDAETVWAQVQSSEIDVPKCIENTR